MPRKSGKIDQKEIITFCKEEKPNEDSELNVPIVTSRKTVHYLTFDYNGEENFFQVLWFVRNQTLILSLYFAMTVKIDYILSTFLIFKILL